MHFLDIPKEVIDDSVLKYLKWNDLLRFRRVCKWTKGITDAYLWVIPARAPEIEINEVDKTLEAFMAMCIPTRKLFLNNAQSGYYFYKQIEEKTLTKFLEDFGPLVNNLRVAQLTITPFGRELEFFDGLKNVKSFEAGYFGDGGMQGGEGEWGEAENAILAGAQDDPRLTILGLPKIFEGLESIRIGLDPYGFCEKFNALDRCCEILLNCPQLKFASLPYDSRFFQTNYVEERGRGGGQVHYNRVLGKSISHLLMYILQRPNEAFSLGKDDDKEQLEVYDFENYHHENVPCTLEDTEERLAKLLMIWVASDCFLHVCSRALEMGLKLRNVNATWFCARFRENIGADYSSPTLGIPVVSLVGLDPCVMQLDMPNLEKLTIPRTSGCVPGLGTRPEWPALKCVDIMVDGKVGQMWDLDGKARLEDIERVVRRPTGLLYKFLFGNGMVRANMSELSIQFVEGKGKQEVAVPKVEDIVLSCPNLKRIQLVNWMGTNKQLAQLWKGLSGLEEISLENCKELGNVAFVGEDVEFPVFLSLENLKKLSLKGLDKMPKITDTFFCLVLSKMKLNELVLTSEVPLEKVTKKGINALLEGPFAETIGRFPFRDWSLADMTAEEFRKMEKKFRSFDMI